MIIKRGDVFYADLDHIIGSEQGGIRPVLVVQNNVGNKYSPTVVVLPNDSVILAEQICTIDRNRLRNYVGSVGFEIMDKLDKAVKISIGVDCNDQIRTSRIC